MTLSCVELIRIVTSRITALRIFTTRAGLATINRSAIIFSKLPLVIHFESIIIRAYESLCNICFHDRLDKRLIDDYASKNNIHPLRLSFSGKFLSLTFFSFKKKKSKRSRSFRKIKMKKSRGEKISLFHPRMAGRA